MADGLLRNTVFAVDELVAFSRECPWKPPTPTQLIRRFLNDFVSTQELILDVHDQSGRVSCAVMLDRVKNPGNLACLEFLGVREGADLQATTSYMLALAKHCCPTDRNGYQVGFHETGVPSDYLLQLHQLQLHYETFEMVCEISCDFAPERPLDISQATLDDAPEIYRVLIESFKDNPEASIPEQSVWLTNYSDPSNRFYICRSSQGMLGFARLIATETTGAAEIRTLGVLPEAQGNGVGRKLLLHCLRESRLQGYSRVQLSVATRNSSALKLYTDTGFEITDRFQTYVFRHTL